MTPGFEVGKQVVCIRNGKNKAEGETDAVVGEVYTIRKIVSFAAGVGLYLEEIINPPVWCTDGLIERGLWIERFRPVKPTSIEVFNQLLVPLPRELVE